MSEREDKTREEMCKVGRKEYLPTRVDAPSASRKLNARAVMVSLMRLGTGRPERYVMLCNVMLCSVMLI